MDFSKRLVVGAFWCMLSLTFQTAWGEEKLFTLSHAVPLRAVPSRAFVVLYENDKVASLVPAVASPVEAAALVTVTSRVALSPATDHLRALFVVYGKTGEVASSEREYRDLGATAPAGLTLEALKKRLSGLKARMKEIRPDAQGIGGGGLGAADGGVDGVALYSGLAKTRLASLGASDRPQNFKRREAELSAHLNLLAAELKSARDASGASDAERELREKRDLIEATKYEQFDLLRDELTRLKRERTQLEESR